MVCGIFIGGRSRRMGGFPKALLRNVWGETLLERTVRVVRAAALDPVLVGDSSAVSHVCNLHALTDARPDMGPLSGLVTLLESVGTGEVIALACDMPWVSAVELRRLSLDAGEAAVLAPHRDDHGWEPLFARYDAGRVAPIAARRLREGALALQGLVEEAGAARFNVEAACLHDVDTVIDAIHAGLHRRVS